MKLKKYMVYLDDGRDCFKIAVPAKDEASARKFVNGNGEVVAVKDVTSDFPISLDAVSRSLQSSGFDKNKIDFILRTLSFCEVAE